jgi:DNA repair protein RadC
MYLTEFKISLKKKGSKLIDRTRVNESADAAAVCRKIFDADTIEYNEEVVLILLNRANEFIGFSKIGMGGTSGVVIDPKMVFTIALQSNAHGIILAHNHPSGNKKPSKADRETTERLRSGAELLDLRLLDHLIISGTSDEYYSFADMDEV